MDFNVLHFVNKQLDDMITPDEVDNHSILSILDYDASDTGYQSEHMSLESSNDSPRETVIIDELSSNDSPRETVIIDEFGQKAGGKPKPKWTTFAHRGVLFPAPYHKHGIPVLYEGEEITLSAEAEEMATLYAKLADTEYMNNSRFRRNFWKSWKKVIGDTEIKDLDGCDFSRITAHLLQARLNNMNMSAEEKKAKTKKKEETTSVFRMAHVDDHDQAVGNFMVEPPGLFIGRGCHPKLGSFKQRIQPEDVTINISKGSTVPLIYYLSSNYDLVEMEDRRWGKVVHDRKVEWIASWRDSIMGKRKYVWLSDTSKFKSASDMKKFDLARKLKKKIHRIRENVSELFHSDSRQKSQLGTAVYLMDKLALRVGNEKGDDEADTVGLTSLRVEHITFEGKDTITLNFLSKDSMRYTNTVKLDPTVYLNLTNYVVSKDGDEPLFETIGPNDVNEYLQSFLKGLTAKSFRTYNASNLFQNRLRKIVKKYEDKNIDELTDTDYKDILEQFERANIDVAKLCNHQKKVVKSLKNQLSGIKERIDIMRRKKRNIQAKKKRTKTDTKRITKLNEKIKALRAKHSLKNELKDISLTTSKINYIDPRIAFAFAKKMRIPAEKVYSKTLLKKFEWASDVEEGFRF